jgi:hypothetical protein
LALGRWTEAVVPDRGDGSRVILVAVDNTKTAAIYVSDLRDLHGGNLLQERRRSRRPRPIS